MKHLRTLAAIAAVAALALASVSLAVAVSAPASAAQAPQAAPVAQAPQPPAEDQVPATNGNIVVRPVHHAGLVLSWNGKRIVADPTTWPPSASSGAADFLGPAPADIILITHEHGDHFSVPTLSELAGPSTIIVAGQSVYNQMTPTVRAKTRVMKNGDKQTIAGVEIEAVPEYNITQERLAYHPKGRDNGYVLNLGGKRVYIAGDTEDTPELRALANIDVAFIPMNLPFTMTVDQAADWVKTFKPKIVYPYHYGESDVNRFKMLVGTASDVRLLKWY